MVSQRVARPARGRPLYLLHHYNWFPIRVPAKPLASPYQYQLYDARRDVRTLAKERIVEATGNPDAEVIWTREERTGVPKNVFKNHVDVENWPRHITYEAPGHKSSVRKLREIADGLRSGRIWFRRLSWAEVARRERELGLSHVEARRARNDVDQVRPLRPLDTRSLLKRKWTGIKTRVEVTEEEDIEAAVWADDVVAARARAEEVDEIEEWED